MDCYQIYHQIKESAIKIVYIGRSAFKSCKTGSVYVKNNDFLYWKGMIDLGAKIEIILYPNPNISSSSEYSCNIQDLGCDFTYLDFYDSSYISKVRKIFYSAQLIKNYKNCFIFLYFPNTFNLIFYSMLISKRIVSYWGNDWEMVNDLRYQQYRQFKNLIMKYVTHQAQRHIVKKSTVSIFAGKDLYSRFNNISKSSLLTSPFITFSKGDKYYRKDTCTNQLIYLTYVGIFSKRKGLMELMNVFNELSIRYSNVRLILVGKGDLEDEINAFIQSNALQDKVELTGYIGDKIKLSSIYKKSDIFVLPSYMEGFPRVVYEAMLNSLPVVCTNVGGIPNFLTNGVHALIHHPGDLKAMQAYIEKIINNKKVREKLIANSYSLIDQIIENPAYVQHFNTLKKQGKK